MNRGRMILELAVAADCARSTALELYEEGIKEGVQFPEGVEKAVLDLRENRKTRIKWHLK